VVKSTNRGTRVWIYRHPDGRVVGFGSVGTTVWRIPHPNGESRTISFIPMLAIGKDFQGQPPGHASCRARFSGQIVGHLIAMAEPLGNRELGLFVAANNLKAQSLYEAFGFQRLPEYVSHGSVIAMVKQLHLGGSEFVLGGPQ
jgi:ribosomal protein S18 acetylase RimI-like enzyme